LVGSCVALCLYDSRVKMAGMAHIMLPESVEGKTSSNPLPARYADSATEALLKAMHRRGSDMSKIRAKIAGGADLFHHETGTSLFTIGKRNAEATRRLLRERGVRLMAEDIGGDHGRRVEFVVETGELIVATRRDGERRL